MLFRSQDHSLFLTSRPRYSFLFKLKQNDYKAWANGLKKAGYATDSTYPNKLIKIIEDYQLFLYDEEVLGLNKTHKKNLDELDHKDKNVSDSIIKTTVAFNNDSSLNSKTHMVVKGETLYALSKKYQVAIDDLKRWNKLGSNAISVGQILIVKKENAQ